MGQEKQEIRLWYFYKWFGDDLFSSIHLPCYIGHEQLRNNSLPNASNR